MQAVEFNTIDANLALEKALANLKGRIQESQAIITVDPLPIVMADKTQLMQLFQNLVGNAIKFRGKATPTIHISAQRQEENGCSLSPIMELVSIPDFPNAFS